MSSPALTPVYVGKNRSEPGLLNTANTNRDGTGTMLDLFVADTTYGSLVERIQALAAGAIGVASSGNIIRLWNKRSSTYRLLAEYAVVTATPSATAVGGTLPGTTTAAPWLTVNIRLQAGDTLAMSIHTVAGTQDNYHVRAEGGDYALP